VKKIFLLFILFIFCGCSDNEESDLEWGYVCHDSGCIEAVNGPYENLENCISACSSNEEKNSIR